MTKQYVDLDRQILRLAVDKSIMFHHHELDVAKDLLRDNNHFVKTSKTKFAELIGGKWKMYKTAEFAEWKAYSEMDKKISKHLINNLLDLELTINSRISHHLSKLIISDALTDYEKNELVLIISQMRDRKNVKFSLYTGEQTWDCVSKMTFGEMKQLVFWLYENKPEIYLQVIDGYSFLRKNVKNRFNELNNLRNSLFHLATLTMYLTDGRSKKRLNNQERKKTVKWVSKLGASQELRDHLKEICFYSDNYVEIKNSLRNVD